MKKTVALILALVMVFALTACGGQNASAKPETADTNAASSGTGNDKAASGDTIVLQAGHVLT